MIVVLSALIWKCLPSSGMWPLLAPRAPLATPNKLLRVLDIVGRVLCVVCACATVYYKWASNRWAYLFQPCHLSTLVLAALCFAPDGTTQRDDAGKPTGRRWFSWLSADKAFHIYNGASFGAWLAMLAPDTRGLDLPGEVVNYWVGHVVLVGLPMVWLAMRRFHCFASWQLSVVTWAGVFLAHYTLLLPLSLLYRENVNFMLVPPAAYPSTVAADYYRVLAGTAFLVLVALCQHGIQRLALRIGSWVGA